MRLHGCVMGDNTGLKYTSFNDVFMVTLSWFSICAALSSWSLPDLDDVAFLQVQTEFHHQRHDQVKVCVCIVHTPSC